MKMNLSEAGRLQACMVDLDGTRYVLGEATLAHYSAELG